MKKLLFVDTETGGLNPKEHSLLTIGMCVYVDGNITDKLEIKLKQDTYHVTSSAMSVNNISLTELDTDIKTAFNMIVMFIKRNFTSKVMLAGHNVNFDIGFLREFWEKGLLTIPEYSRNQFLWYKIFDYHYVDTMQICQFLNDANIIKTENNKLESLIKYFNLNPSSRHTALEDAIMTSLSYFNMIKRVNGVVI